MSTIAFIGLGNMGIGMAANLAKGGHKVMALDISKDAIAVSYTHLTLSTICSV